MSREKAQRAHVLQRQEFAAVVGVAAAVGGDTVVAAALVPAVQPGVAADRLLAQLPTASRVLHGEVVEAHVQRLLRK
jgi:hypothetical protein